MTRYVFEDRIFRCGQSDYYGDEILAADRAHTAERLKAIADAGFNGVWLHARLRELVPGKLFGRYVRRCDDRLESLELLCARARRCGLNVWLYFTEPLGLDINDRFWKDHPDLRGHVNKVLRDRPVDAALCSSTEPVREFLHEGFHQLFKKVPVAGAILITASEHISNCWSRVMRGPHSRSSSQHLWSSACGCPRCGPRGPVDVVIEVISLISGGVKSAGKDAKVVAWDWSWNMYLPPPYRKLVDRLDRDVILMGDFERGGRAQRLGRKFEVEEYSLIHAGPSPRYRREVETFAAGRKMWAKLQINTTHELATVPSLPLVASLYRKFKYLTDAGVRGYMASWNFGCRPDTLNVFAVDRLSRGRFDRDEEKWLRQLVKDYFQLRSSGQDVVRALYAFVRAVESYPIGGNCFLYFGPMNYALVYPLKMRFAGKPMERSWIRHEPGDRLEDTVGAYTLEQVAGLLGRLSSRWADAARLYEQALADADERQRAQQEAAVAKVAAAAFRSAWNIYRWYLTRRRKQGQRLSRDETQIIADEIENLHGALPYVRADDRIGFHDEAQCYMFDATAIEQKLKEMKKRII